MKTENKDVIFEKSDTAIGSKTEVTESSVETLNMPESAEVEKVIRESVYVSMGIGIVPVTLFNLAAVTADNLNLARKLSNLYGVEFKEDIAKKIIIAVTGASAGTLASPVVEMAVIGIPLVGLPLAIGTRPALNGMTTYALGRMFVTHFERGGSFIGANVESMKEDFAAAYKNSREWLGNVISGKKEENPVNA